MIINKINQLRDNQGYLFSEKEMYPRINADREKVLETFKDKAQELVALMLEAGNQYLDFARKHSKARQEHNFAPTMIQGLIIEKLFTPKYVKVKKINNDCSILEIDGYTIWIKKLDDNLKPKINNTKSSIMRFNQKTDNEDATPMLILGYQLDSLQRIVNIFLVYRNGEKMLWPPINLGDIAASSTRMFISSTAKSNDVAEVKVKKNKKRGTSSLAD